MLTSLIALVFLFLLVAGVSVLLKQKADDCWPVCISSVVLWLYAFYCFSGLWLGTKLLCIGIIGVFLLAWRKQGSIGQMLVAVFSPGTTVYLVLCGLFVLFFSGNHVTLHDELRLWAAVPKAMYATGELQLGKDAIIFPIMHSYPPGLPLILYFFTSFSKEFSEGALYVGYACTTLAFFVPAFSRWNWKNWPLLAFAGTVVMLTPFFFTSHFCDMGLFGKTLFVDPLLGVLAGVAFWQASQKPFKTWFDTITFAAVLAFLCLCKKTGLEFAAFALLCAVIADRGDHKARILAPIVIIGLSYGGWYILQTMYAVYVPRPLEVHRLSLSEIWNVVKALFSVNVIAYRVPLGVFGSFAGVYTFLWAIYCWILRISGKRKSWDMILVNAGILISTVLFIYGYALLYAENLESFSRYMATPLLSLSVCLILEGFPVLFLSKKTTDFLNHFSLRKHIVFSCIIAVCCCCFLYVWGAIFPEKEDLAQIDASAECIRSMVLQNKSEKEKARIYAVIAGNGYGNSHLHHRIYFDLISEDINISNGLAQTQVVDPEIEDPVSTWADELKSGFNFVYLISVEEALRPVFAEFTDDPAEPGTLYRVIPSDNTYGVALTKQ